MRDNHSSSQQSEAFAGELLANLEDESNPKKSESIFTKEVSLKNAKDDILNSLSNAFLSNQPNEKAALADFVSLKSSPSIENRLKAIEQYSEKELGQDNWVMGLLGMLYDASREEAVLMDTIIEKLSQAFLEAETFMQLSILKGLVSKAGDLSEIAKRHFIDTLCHDTFISDLRDKRHQMVTKELIDQCTIVIDQIGSDADKQAFLAAIEKQALAQKREKSQEKSRSKVQHFIRVPETKPVDKVDLSSMNEHKVRPMKERVMWHSKEKGILQKVALVTHYAYESKQKPSGVFLLSNKDSLNVSDCEQLFQSLESVQFTDVFVCLKHGQFYDDIHIANQTIDTHKNRIFVLDTFTTGLGLRSLMHVLSRQIIDHNAKEDIMFLAANIIDKSKYWVVPQQSTVLEQSPSFQRQALFNKGKNPVVGFHKRGGILSNHDSFKEAIAAVLENIERHILESKSPISEIIIEYFDHEELAKRLAPHIQKINPSLYISIQEADMESKRSFGPFIGVAII